MWGGGTGSFLASGGTYLSQGWSKNGYFLGQYQAPMAGWFRGGDLTWKVFYEPYQPPMHRTTLFRPILALSRYPPGPGVVQKWLFFGSKSGLYGGLVLGWRVPPRNCFVCHITPQCMEKHELGPFLPPPGTHPGPGVVQKWLFFGSKSGLYGGLV